MPSHSLPPPMKTSVRWMGHPFVCRLAAAITIVFCFAMLARAGGPKYVAGVTFFDSSATGQPLTWPAGQVTYFTDQGDLSPILANSDANTLVANAFSAWTSVPTAAVSASSGGQLAEDVTGANVIRNPDGTITMPTDIQPSAIGTPVGVVYDFDGSVTDALLGAGAGDPSQCFFNAVYGGVDNFAATASYQHALIVMNGQCALESSQLVDVQYRLQRVIGNVLGVAWSQLNLNVLTGTPTPTADDLAGFPLMHYTDPTACAPITRCYPNPLQLAADDVAAVSRLYPVTPENQANFPNSRVFSATTGSIHGSVWFTDSSGNRTQPMQGVNVVARWINPATGLPSRQFAASSVSGFLFTGNAGNPITGFDDALGNPFSNFGSTSPNLEGFFDLAGLQLPSGGTAQYQLSIEPVDPTWSIGVPPYGPFQVTPSGSFQPLVVTVSAGQDVDQDIFMTTSAQPVPQWAASETWTDPAPIPPAGDWIGSLNGFGDTAYFLLSAQANRSLSVAVMALDESGNASEAKAQPVIAMWAASDPQGTAPPALTPSPFNSILSGVTRLDADVAASTNFLVGIADLRGEGRPDYHYHASVLYADSVSPARVSVAGGAVAVQGTGFSPSLAVNIGALAATPLAVSAGQMIVAAPPQPDGPQNFTVSNAANGGSSTISNAITYGAAASDNLILLSGLNPSTPVGTQATRPVRARVVASDGVTPVSGATIGWSATNNLRLSACTGTSSCSVTTDQSGNAASFLTPTQAGVANITATLAPGVYTPVQSVTATLNATESASDIGVLTPFLWISQGATASIPLTARVLSKGVPQNRQRVNFTVVIGSGSLSAPNAATNSSGNATVSLSVTQFSALTQVSACVSPANAPCVTIFANPVPLSQQNLQQIAGAGQVSTGLPFHPVVVLVTDSSSPPNPVVAAPITFQTTVLRPTGSPVPSGGGETTPTNPAMPVILSVSQTSTTTDLTGSASIVPSSGGFSAPLEVDVGITAGIGISLDDPLLLLPGSASANIAPAPQRFLERRPTSADCD
jgi:hypothetical protein